MLFVSIRQVHDAIAERIEVPNSEIESFGLSKLPETRPMLGIRVATFGILGRGSFMEVLRYRFAKSEAALQLDQVLNHAAYLVDPLHWMDGRETGKIKVNPKAAQDVLPALVDLGKHFARCRKEHFEGNNILDQKLYSLWDHLDPKRLDEIGFIVEEIIPILDRAGIQHSLTRPIDDAMVSSSHSVEASEKQIPHSTVAARIENLEPAPVVSVPAQVHLMDYSNAFTMDGLIEQVVDHVRKGARWTPGKRGNKADFTRAVWNRLVARAQEEDKRPSFLIGYDSRENIVLFRSNFSREKMCLERLRGKLRQRFEEVLAEIK